MAEALIAIGGLALTVCWVIYPLTMFVASRVRARRPPANDVEPASASIVIATRDDPETVAARVADLERCQGELQRLDIVVAVDPAGGREVQRYRQLLAGRATVVVGDEPGGKAATLNAGVRAATQQLVIFTDSAQEFVAGTLRSLVRTLQEPGVGAATGQFRAASNRRSLLLGAFWAYETWLRNAESKVDSLVGVTGAVYAIRHSLWEALPPGLINDDMYVPLAIVARGYRVVTCTGAYAVDHRTFTAAQEFRRKVRTLTGILQLCALRPSLLNPLRNRLWAQFLCHKLLRFATPYWVLLVLIGALAVVPLRLALLALVSAAAALSAVCWAPKASLLSRAATQFAWAALILCAPLVATAYALRGDWDVWSAAASAKASDSTKSRQPAAIP